MCFSLLKFSNFISVAQKEEKRARVTTGDFDRASERTKRRKTEEMHSVFNSSELVLATQTSLRTSGAGHATSIVKVIVVPVNKQAFL